MDGGYHSNDPPKKLTYTKLTSPEEIPERFVSGWNNRDVDEMMSAFAEDAEFVNVVGLWWHNIDEIRKAHDYGLEVIFKDSILKVQKITVKEVSDDVSVVHAKMRLKDQTAKGEVKQPQLRQNIFTFVAQKTKEGWKCVAAHNTDIVPGAETNIVNEDGQVNSISYRS